MYVYIMYIYRVLLAIALFHMPILAVSGDVAESTACTCGAFTAIELKPEDGPLLKESPFNVTCDDVGSEKCKITCKELVENVQDLAADFLCNFLEHTDKILPSLHTKICDRSWVYSGLSFENELCCHAGKKIDCV